MIASDAQHFVPPGISIHQEMELLVSEVGLSPMQALEGATKRPAEFLGHLQDFGTIEKGKLADLVILNSNPLEDIRNTRDIIQVIQAGKAVERTYHRYFTNPVPRPKAEYGGEFPSPQIVAITPPSLSCSSASQVVVTIRGTGFTPQSFVRVRGRGQDMEYVSPTEIRTELSCKSLPSPGTHSLVVVNPKPIKENETDVSNAFNFVLN